MRLILMRLDQLAYPPRVLKTLAISVAVKAGRMKFGTLPENSTA